jgi:flagellar biosynthesis/type III secretory pathway M-ring protein FliF/YscJ
MIPDTVNNVVAALLIGLGVCGLIVCVVMLVRERRKDRQWRQQWEDQRRRWEREDRLHRRVSELLAQEYENLLTSEARQRREAQRRHLAALRARAEAELDAEAARR